MPTKPNELEQSVLLAIFRNGSRNGDSLSDLSEMTGLSIQRLVAVATKFNGVRFKIGTIHYVGPSEGSFKQACPGIKNPRTGISARIPAMIFVK